MTNRTISTRRLRLRRKSAQLNPPRARREEREALPRVPRCLARDRLAETESTRDIISVAGFARPSVGCRAATKLELSLSSPPRFSPLAIRKHLPPQPLCAPSVIPTPEESRSDFTTAPRGEGAGRNNIDYGNAEYDFTCAEESKEKRLLITRNTEFCENVLQTSPVNL